MKKQILIPTLILASASTAFAQWTRLSDAEDTAFPEWTMTQSELGYGSMTAATDPVEGDENTGGVLYVQTGGFGTSWGHTGAALPLSTPIADGEIGTIYVRYYEAANSREYVYGFTDKVITPDGLGAYSQPKEWGDFEGAIQMGPNSSVLKVRDAGAYNALTADDGVSDATVDAGVWYELWIVVDNATGSASDQYYTYIKGGAYTTQTLLKVQSGGGDFESALFRNGTTDPIVNFYVRTLASDPGAPNNGDPVYIDHLAQAPGTELSTPTGWTDVGGGVIVEDEYWADYLIEDGSVDTGDWLGWLNVSKEPWIFSYTLNDWIYIKEADVTDGGSWVYFKK